MEYGRGRSTALHFKSAMKVTVVLLLLLTRSSMAKTGFVWLFGQWGECQHRTCGLGGQQNREVWCMYIQTGLRVLDNYCRPELKPESSADCIKSCSENIILKPHDAYQGETMYESHSPNYPDYDHEWKHIGLGSRDEVDPEIRTARGRQEYSVTLSTSEVEWVVDQWNSCRLLPGAKLCAKNSGIQYRKVTCERKDKQGNASHSRCQMEEPMPATNQPCELLCKQNCVVSTYTEWSGCADTCQFSNQTRSRRVIVPPRHQGTHCPSLSEMTTCDNCTQSYTYKLSEWLPCTPFSGSYKSDVRAHDLIGYQTREITCLQSKGVLTSLRLCSEKHPRMTLQKYRTCIMPQDCRVSPWSPMRPHNISCIGYDGQVHHGYMVRSRQVLQLALGDGQACPAKLIEYIRLNKEETGQLKSCKRAKWIMSSWSQCQSVPGYNHCGTGIQGRRAICVEAGDDGVERPAEDGKCPQPKPVVAQLCPLECGWDCSVSQWSGWSSCQDLDCDRTSLRKRRAEGKTGKRARTREILTLAGPGGSACPHLSETQMCLPEPCYTWNITYGPCEATARGGCSDGTQLKKALCLNREGVKVRERFCHESLHSEQNWANCYVPCPVDCILSSWGQWSLCPDPCHVQAGVYSLRSRQRQVLAYHDPGLASRPCPSISELRQTESCPVLYDCSTYQWETSSWGQCRLKIENPNVQCGPGTQNRTVRCYTSKGIIAADNKCMEKVKPQASQPCMVQCPVDCHVTEWSDWSDCGVKCLPVQARQIYPTQVRRRFILQYPQFGGIPCPIDLREEQSCFGLPVCQTYFWKVTDYSDCLLPPVVPLCGQGLRARNITCHLADGQNTQDLPVVVCLEKLGSLPDMTNVCHIPCESECLFSAWSQWTSCGPRCEKTKFRFRRLMDVSKNIPECRNTELYPRDEHEDCVCDTAQPALIGGWSDCIIQSPEVEDVKFASMSLTSLTARHKRTNETGVTGLGSQIYCGAGKRYMAVFCHKLGLEGVVDSLGCSGEEYQEENCTIACPIDCQTTLWSSWSPCSSSCGSGLQQRERRIMALPENGGRKCPSVFGFDKEIQTKVCNVDCTYYVWRVEDWGPCLPSGARTCGDGTHSRIIRCVSLSNEDLEMTVDESYCPTNDIPVRGKPCTLACPGECVLSEWSDWSLCRQPCNGKQTQSRVRQVLRMPANYDITGACTMQKEEKLCERWKNCIEYLWELADWTSCLVNSGSSECGVGHKERFALCRKENGDMVEPYKCDKLFGSVSEPLVVSCEVPCDNDCLLSDWSEWSMCSASCGLGFTKRKRSVLQNSMGNGRKCSDYLEQTKPCVHQGCYKWFVSEWTHCIIENGVCGSGVQERNISCYNDDGRAVSFSHCPTDTELYVMQTSRPCYVPCPGECRMSVWSTWSECYISCEDFEQGYTVGVQARSQAILAYPTPSNTPCNENLWEEQACEAKKCSYFTWMTSEWDMSTMSRHVLCVRNDGITVVGGCADNDIPSSVLNCMNPVCLSPAVCVDLNVCTCTSEDDWRKHYINETTMTCIKNMTVVSEITSGADNAKSTNIWMYALIAVGTLFVIAVTAALYNMCELFRTGPRPRRKEECSPEASTTGTFHCMQVLHEKENGIMGSDGQPCDNICKQINHKDQVGRNVYSETVFSSFNYPNACHKISTPMSCSPDTANTSSTLESSSLTTTTTLLTPTNTDYRSNRSCTMKAQGAELNSHSFNQSPSFHRKHNRRLKRIHRLLPARFANCFFCNHDPPKHVLNKHILDMDIDKIAGYQDQMLSLIATDAHLCTEDCYTNTSPSFQTHDCMLSHTRDHRPTNLDLPMHDNLYNIANESGIIVEKISSTRDPILSGPVVNEISMMLQVNSQSQRSLQLEDTSENLILQKDSSKRSPLKQQHESSNRLSTSTIKSVSISASTIDITNAHLDNTTLLPSFLLASSSSCCSNDLSKNSIEIPDDSDQHICLCTNPDTNKNHLSSQSSVPPLHSCHNEYLTPNIYHKSSSSNKSRPPDPDMPSPITLSTFSQSICGIHGNQKAPNKIQPLYRTRPTLSTFNNNHVSKERDQRTGWSKATPLTFPPPPSLSENDSRDIEEMFRTNSQIIEQISQDSGHSTTPRSQTASPEQTADSTDFINDGTCCELFDPHVHTYQQPHQCTSFASFFSDFDNHMAGPDTTIYPTGAPDSSSSHHDASINSLETSV